MQEYLGRKHYTKEENEQFYNDIRSFYATIREDKKIELTGKRDYDIIARALLDSSLIFPTREQVFTHKIVECGNYYKVYNYFKRTTKKDKNIEKEKYGSELARIRILESIDNEKEEEKESRGNIRASPDTELKKIELKNINRSKSEMTNLVKANEDIFKTFITLTFEDAKYEDIKLANKKFDIWRTKIKSKKRDFVYICVPEFQKKRGKLTGHYVVHYHLLTNLEKDDNLNLIIPQTQFSEKQMKKMTEEQRKNCYDVKYWSYGYSSVFDVKDINVVAYMTKYMTKDIDHRLWGKRRYLASHNLKKPSTIYLDDKKAVDWLRLTCIETSMNLEYENVYCNALTGEAVSFKEYKRNNEVDSEILQKLFDTDKESELDNNV